MRRQQVLVALTVVLGVGFIFQNCSKVGFNGAVANSVVDSQRTTILSAGQATIDPSQPNPELNLFFIVDNSASMLGHQIDLGAAFASVFQNNTENLSRFDTNIYVFSTASTINTSYLSGIPTLSPKLVSSIPGASDTSSLSQIPGGIFGFWKTQSGTYGNAPFSASFAPAPVLNMDLGVVKPFLTIKKRGVQTDAEYAAQLSALTAAFQARLQFLNPSAQLAYSPLTDVSSGLCTMARVLKHASDFVQPGASAAFIIVSDDNDRLNVRNSNSNQCLESIMASDSVVDGTCGHYETKFSYVPGAAVTYQSDTRVTYPSGTKVGYSLPVSGETCKISYNSGYNYTWKYTAVKTKVTYDRCDQIADGVCLKTAAGATQTVDGNYVSGGNSCSAAVSGVVSSPLQGTTFACVTANVGGQVGTPGVDSASNGTSCSANVVSQLSAQANKTSIACSVGAATSTTKSITGQTVGACASYCSEHLSTYPGCSLVSTSQAKTTASFDLPFQGLSCSSACPDSTKCGSSTIADYIVATFGAGSTCNTTSSIVSTLVVNAGAASNGSALTATSSLAGLTVKNSGGAVVCAGEATVAACVSSLQQGAVATISSSGTNVGLNVPTGVSCSTSCSASGGVCMAGQYSTVADFIAKNKFGLCKSASNKSATNFNLSFNNSVAAVANCASKCSETLQGSCDGKGYGAADGSTVADYIANVLGGAQTCAANTSYVAVGGQVSVDAGNLANACMAAANSVFKSSGSAHAGSNVLSYVAGDASHKVSDLQNYIVSQSTAIFGSARPAVAVITQLAGDNLQGTDVGTSYIQMAAAMGSGQVTSIKGDYSKALTDISQFIVNTAKNSILLPLSQGDVVVSVAVMRKGNTVWEDLDASAWSWAGQTLSFSAGAGLNIGDQIMYKYHAP